LPASSRSYVNQLFELSKFYDVQHLAKVTGSNYCGSIYWTSTKESVDS